MKRSSKKSATPAAAPVIRSPELAALEAIVVAAHEIHCPENVFGILGKTQAEQEKTLGLMFRSLARKLHPDVKGNGASEADAMARLTDLHAQAETKIRAGTYGQKDVAARVTVRLGSNIYEEVSPLCAGDISDVYSAVLRHPPGSPNSTVTVSPDLKMMDDLVTDPVVIKIARSHTDRDLVSNEVRMLRKLADPKLKGWEHFLRYLPRFIKSADLDVSGTRRPAVVLRRHVHTHTSLEVRKAFPVGIDPRDAAWMWRRLLEVLVWVGDQGIVHGAILPPHFLIRPGDHGSKLIDWSYSVESGHPLKALVPAWESFYPPEVRKKLPATAATDIFMSAKLALYLQGGDVESDTMPDSVPKAIKQLIQSCLILNPHRRYGSALDVYRQYDDILRRLYGPPAFREFHMPGVSKPLTSTPTPTPANAGAGT